MPVDQDQLVVNRAVNGAVSVDGEMTIYRASEVARTLFATLRAHGGDVSLDLSAVTEFDTAGLQIVLMARRMVEAGGHRLDVVQPSACVAEVLELCNVTVSTGSQQAAA